jgi:hypothetical protein
MINYFALFTPEELFLFVRRIFLKKNKFSYYSLKKKKLNKKELKLLIFPIKVDLQMLNWIHSIRSIALRIYYKRIKLKIFAKISQWKRSVSALLSDDNELTITCPLTRPSRHKSRAISGIINEEFKGSTSITHTHNRKIVPCNCPKCNRDLVDVRTKIAHEIEQDLDNE